MRYVGILVALPCVALCSGILGAIDLSCGARLNRKHTHDEGAEQR